MTTTDNPVFYDPFAAADPSPINPQRYTPVDKADLEGKIAATLDAPGAVTWKAYGRGAFNSTFFIRFGTPPTYSRSVVREIAVRIFERHSARPSLYAIRRTDIKDAPWVHTSQFRGIDQVGEHFGPSED